MNSFIPWVGGKGKLLWIINKLMPDRYTRFIDVFGGSGTVTMCRPIQRGCMEVYNDFNGNLTNLFCCVKNRPMALLAELGFLPLNTRDDFNVLYKFFSKGEFTDDYAIIKVFFANLKRGGILLIQIAVGSLYMFSVPRGYTDGFIQWCKQIIGLCLSAFLQATILVAGLMVFKDHALLGLGLMLSAGEIPRIAGAFGLDTSTKANLMSAVYTAQAAVNTTRTVVQAVAK